MENLELITKYIATWGWQILSMLFLSTSIILFALPRTLITQAMYVAMFLVFAICLFMSLKRKQELYNEN